MLSTTRCGQPAASCDRLQAAILSPEDYKCLRPHSTPQGALFSNWDVIDDL